MTLKEIAKIAGVSSSTVSRVVNSGDHSAASPETEERIWKVVRETGYVPNQSARNLKSSPKRSGMVSHDIDCIYARTAGPQIDTFFPLLMHAVEVEVFPHGYNFRYQYSINDVLDGKYHHEITTDSAVVLGRVDARTMNYLKRHYKNLVFASLQQMDYEVDQVISSGYQASMKCVNYLASLGHKSICYLGEIYNEQRYQGYLDGLAANGIPFSKELVVDTPFEPSGGYEGTLSLIHRNVPFTAILCANDLLAMGSLRALKEHKYSVPADVSLIGINDMESSQYMTPMLTTVRIPIEEMGKHVSMILISRIEGHHKLPVTLTVPNKLVIRESCGKPPR